MEMPGGRQHHPHPHLLPREPEGPDAGEGELMLGWQRVHQITAMGDGVAGIHRWYQGLVLLGDN